MKIKNKEMTIEGKKRAGWLSRIMRRAFFRVILILIVVIVMGSGIIWLKNLILSRQVQTAAVVTGKLEIIMPTDGLFVNTETIVISNLDGRLEKIAKQGERVRKGAVFSRVTSDTKGIKSELTAPSSGVVSYNIDGLEGVLTPKNISEWELEKIINLKPQATTGDTVIAGVGAAKIIDSLLPTYILFKMPKAGLTYAPGSKMTLLIGEDRFLTKVIAVSKQGPEAGVVVSMPGFLPQSIVQRQTKLSWVDEDRQIGLIIPEDAIFDRGGVTGVYVLRKGLVTWQTVDVEGRGDAKARVKGVNTGEFVITTPGLVKEGQILNVR